MIITPTELTRKKRSCDPEAGRASLLFMALLLGTLALSPPAGAAPPPVSTLARRARLAPLVPRLGVALRFDGLTDGLSALGPARRGATIAAWLAWPLGAAPPAGVALEDARVASTERAARERRWAAWRQRAAMERAAAAAVGTLDARVEARLAADEAEAALDALGAVDPGDDDDARDDQNPVPRLERTRTDEAER
jgi:hypothetical protein